MAYPVILENDLLRVEEVREQQTIIVRRLPDRAPDTATLIGTYQEALAASSIFKGWSVILDVREAPPRNDHEFESALGAMRKKLDAVFVRVVTLVATAAGALQVRRFARENGREALVTHDEDEALRMCRER
ncbi:MAG: hypothetical protein H6719_19400 [Sandaracinaceae bacterium]|nr:hypothetical protein [Sandaracinaceae bacterium]